MKTSLLLLSVFLVSSPLGASEKDLAALLEAVEKVPARPAPDYAKEIRERRDALNRADLERWRGIKTKEQWERHRNVVLEKLRERMGLNDYRPLGKEMKVVVSSTLKGEGFLVENLVYESHTPVTANLYLPDPPVKDPPAILIIHSHHNSRTQGELQDMGMTFARLGCLVLIPDQLGHGERRLHPFKKAEDFPAPFKAGRQDYYFRFDAGARLALVGESLAGWMARDMMRGVDLVLNRGADPKRIILMGSVAGGGDPCGVTGALDERIACVVPFNFGGPQPETKYPLPENAEETFNYMGGGSWESTRGLAFSAKDGFLPWAIVASIAPRKLIHGHEFSWDQKRDPVWARLRTIYGWHEAGDSLSFAHGTGLLSGMAPEASHCNNIGPVHRKMIYPSLQKWFGIAIPEKEHQKRFEGEKLIAWTAGAEKTTQALLFHEKLLQFSHKLPEEAVVDLKRRVLKVLAGGTPWPDASWEAGEVISQGKVQLRPALVKDSRDLIVASVWILAPAEGKKAPFVVGIAQQGNKEFLKHRAEAISDLLEKGIGVVLVESRGMGSLGFPGDGRGRTSISTGLSATEWMLGRTLLGQRLSDLRTALLLVKKQPGLDGSRVLLWGDSFAPVNNLKETMVMPHDAGKRPAMAEPNGAHLALLAAALEPEVKGVYVQGGLIAFRTLLDKPMLYVPHDALLPSGAAGQDINEMVGILGARPVRMEGPVDGFNQRWPRKELEKAYFARGLEKGSFILNAEPSPQKEVSAWMGKVLVP